MKLFTVVTMVAALVATLATGCGRDETQQNAASSLRVHTLDESNFDAETQSGVVLVDFWATWCGPCKTQAPVMEQVAEQVEGKAKVAKLDIDAAPKIAQRFGVLGVPTLIVFKDGKPTKQFLGFTKAEPLVTAITSTVDSKTSTVDSKTSTVDSKTSTVDSK